MNDAVRGWTGERTADEVVAACVQARVPATVVGNGAELPRFDHVIARDVLVRQPGEDWVRPRAPFRFHGVADRELAPPGGRVDATPWPVRTRSPDAEAVGDRPLAGVKVLDFTAFWAGPAATAWLCAMGADVIKVEAVQRPDGIRFSAAVRPRDDPQFYEKSALFHASNLGKRGITLDLGHPDGLDIAKRLVERCDVVVENFTPRVLEQFGLDYDVVRALRPDAVMVRMPAFGLTGPWRDRPGFAQTMEQITGMAWVTGYEGGPPIIPGGVVDPMVGAHAALAVVAALEHRARTGEGQLVEMALLEVATAVTAEQVIRYAIDQTLADRRGTSGVYRALGDDDWIAVDVAVRSDAGRRASRVVRRPARPRTPRPSCAARASRRRRWCPATRHSMIRRCARGGSSRRSTIRWSVARSTRPGRCGCRPARRATGPVRRRRWVNTQKQCCAPSSASPTASWRGCATSTSSAMSRTSADRCRKPSAPTCEQPDESTTSTTSRASSSKTRSSTATCRSGGVPRRPRCGIAISAFSTSAPSRRTSARGCRTWCSARTR